jgi:Holliday junction DNA helicase RuvA
MISSLSGKVASTSLNNNVNTVVLEIGGIGISINVPNRVIESVKIGDQIQLQTYLVVREDALTLYGFTEMADRSLFELLLTVTGVGPKVAQSILGINPASVVAAAIKNNDLKVLEAIPGLGKKGAQRLVLELKDKLASYSNAPASANLSIKDQVESALQGLGYTVKESALMVDQALDKNADKEIDLAQAIKLALSTKNSGKN